MCKKEDLVENSKKLLFYTFRRKNFTLFDATVSLITLSKYTRVAVVDSEYITCYSAFNTHHSLNIICKSIISKKPIKWRELNIEPILGEKYHDFLKFISDRVLSLKTNRYSKSIELLSYLFGSKIISFFVKNRCINFVDIISDALIACGVKLPMRPRNPNMLFEMLKVIIHAKEMEAKYEKKELEKSRNDNN